MSINPRWIWVVIVVFCVIVINLHSVTGQDRQPRNDMAGLFGELLQRVNDDVDFSFRVSLINPIFDGQVDVWVGLSYDTYVSSIGDDYVCFTKQFSQSMHTQCVPYHNIGGVMYED